MKTVHFQPGFCPQRLRDYKSQGDDSDGFAFLQSLHPTDLNIRIHEDDPSKRIPDWWLEQLWMIPSQDGILRLPLWAKRDDIIQRIIDKEEVDQVVYYGDYSQKRRSSPPARTVSSSPEISAEKKAKALLDFERHCKRGRKRKRDSSPVWLDLNQGRSRNTTEDDNDPASASIERITALSDIQSHLAAAPPTQRTGRCRSETISTLELDLAKRASRLHASYTKKRSRSHE